MWEVPRVVNFIETEIRVVGARGTCISKCFIMNMEYFIFINLKKKVLHDLVYLKQRIRNTRSNMT